MELEQNLSLFILQAGVLEQNLDGEYAGEMGVAGQVELDGEAALLGLRSSRLALATMHASLQDSKLVVWAWLSRR